MRLHTTFHPATWLSSTAPRSEKKVYGKSFMAIVRSSFLIDEAGNIVTAWYKIKLEIMVLEAKKVLEFLQ
jgi:peroxiredoxin